MRAAILSLHERIKIAEVDGRDSSEVANKEEWRNGESFSLDRNLNTDGACKDSGVKILSLTKRKEKACDGCNTLVVANYEDVTKGLGKKYFTSHRSDDHLLPLLPSRESSSP